MSGCQIGSGIRRVSLNGVIFTSSSTSCRRGGREKNRTRSRTSTSSQAISSPIAIAARRLPQVRSGERRDASARGAGVEVVSPAFTSAIL